MPRCEVMWLAGRTLKQQDQIAEKITNVFVEVLDSNPEDVVVVFRQTDPAAYYTGGISETMNKG